jgi:hypothetical protein
VGVAGDRVLTLGAGLALAAASVQTTSHLVNEFLLDGEIRNLDADAEFAAFAWAGSVAIFAAGLGATLIATVGVGPRHLFGIGALLAFLSLDEVVQVHEQLALELTERFDVPDYVGVRLWLVLYGPVLLALALLLWRFAAGLARAARRMLALGLGLLVAAVALEAAGLPTKWLADRGVEWPDVVRIASEEAAELGGWMLVATALFAVLSAPDLGAER